MQLSELQNELRIERMQRDTQAVSLHDTQGRLHAADAAELASLRQQRDETARARAEAGQQFIELAQEREQDRVEKVRLEEQVRAAHSLSGDWLAEQNLQLRQITQLQLVQAELQTELARKEEQLDAARPHLLHRLHTHPHTRHTLHLLHLCIPCTPCAPPPPLQICFTCLRSSTPCPPAPTGAPRHLPGSERKQWRCRGRVQPGGTVRPASAARRRHSRRRHRAARAQPATASSLHRPTAAGACHVNAAITLAARHARVRRRRQRW